MKNFGIKLVTAMFMFTSPVLAAGGKQEIQDYDFSFDGIFGHYDQLELQRGLKVYTEVCSACHGMKLLSFRNLEDLGYSEDQVIEYAQQYEIYDNDLEDYRPAGYNDKFPANNSVGAPDLSLMAKARVGGPDYIASLLEGYTGEEKETAGVTLYENKAYGGYLSMSPPLYGDDIEYDDGTEATLTQEAKDVSAFLMWAAEPKLNQRKEAGFVAVILLSIFTLLLFLVKKRVWHREH